MDENLCLGRVTLRRLEESDLNCEEFILGLSDHYNHKHSLNKTRESLKTLNNFFGSDSNNVVFFIIQIDKKPSGFMLLDNIRVYNKSSTYSSRKNKDSEKSGELGTFIIKKYRGYRFINSCMKLFLKYCFEKCDISQINSIIEKNNISSIKLNEKFGFDKVNFRFSFSNFKFILTRYKYKQFVDKN